MQLLLLGIQPAILVFDDWSQQFFIVENYLPVLVLQVGAVV